jgi:hypothetical protein
MNTSSTTGLRPAQITAALAAGTIALLVIGVQPIVLGEMLEARQVTLEGVGLVAMGEIVALGLGVALSHALLPLSRLRMAVILAGLVAAALDLATRAAVGDAETALVRAAAGAAEGVLVWGATCVVVRAANPERLGGIFFVVQTLAQAAFGFALALWVIPQLGWQGSFTALALLSGAASAVAAAMPRSVDPLPEPRKSGFRWSARTALPLAAAFLQLGAIGAFWAYLEPLGKAVGLDARSAQTLVSAVLVAQVLGGSAATMAVRRWPAAPALAVGSSLLAALTLSMFVLPPGNTAAFAGACAAFGFVWLFLLPFQIAFALHADPTGRVATLVPAFQLVGSAMGPLAASFAVTGDDAAAVLLVSAVFAVLVVMALFPACRPAAVPTR